MRENSVILLEDDYKTKYREFDPSSVESYIMFEFMQDKYLDKSIDFAHTIQKQFTNYARRSDRGVRQAGFWVLHRSACPSVLIELGFISNQTEERYLASSEGQQNLANSVYNAFVNFKKNHDNKSGIQTSARNYVEISKAAESPIKTEEPNAEAVSYTHLDVYKRQTYITINKCTWICGILYAFNIRIIISPMSFPKIRCITKPNTWG